jgi:hypothetical protein
MVPGILALVAKALVFAGFSQGLRQRPPASAKHYFGWEIVADIFANTSAGLDLLRVPRGGGKLNDLAAHCRTSL